MTVQPWHVGRQRVLNAPPVPAALRTSARAVPVTVQLVWERDGVEWVEAEAHGHSGQLVHVVVDDPRLQVIGLWLDAQDVRRRPVAAWKRD